MESVLTISQRERDRLKILTQVCNRQLSLADASHILQLSQQQLFCLLKRYRRVGDPGLSHKLRGRPSNRGYPGAARDRVVTLYWHQHRDYGPTLFSEMLVEKHHVDVDHETIRRWLMAFGDSSIQRKKRPRRRKRPRRSAIGELIQFDGSTLDWFEGRGSSCFVARQLEK